MKTKNNILLSAFLFSFIICLAIVSATVTTNTPTSGLAINGTYLFNITIDQNETLNCTFATTGDGIFQIVANTSAEQSEFTTTNDTNVLTEALATTLTVTCTNSSGDVEVGTQTFDIDNTDPVCSFTISQDFTTRQSGLGITVLDGSSDTTTLTYNYTIMNSDGTIKNEYSTSAPTFSNGDLEDIGDHNITLILTDEVSKTSQCSVDLLVKGSSDDGGTIVAGTSPILGKDKMLLVGILGLVIFIVLIGGIFMFFLNKTKKR